MIRFQSTWADIRPSTKNTVLLSVIGSDSLRSIRFWNKSWLRDIFSSQALCFDKHQLGELWTMESFDKVTANVPTNFAQLQSLCETKRNKTNRRKELESNPFPVFVAAKTRHCDHGTVSPKLETFDSNGQFILSHFWDYWQLATYLSLFSRDECTCKIIAARILGLITMWFTPMPALSKRGKTNRSFRRRKQILFGRGALRVHLLSLLSRVR